MPVVSGLLFVMSFELKFKKILSCELMLYCCLMEGQILMRMSERLTTVWNLQNNVHHG